MNTQSDKIIEYEVDKKTGCWNCTNVKRLSSSGYPIISIHCVDIPVKKLRYEQTKKVRLGKMDALILTCGNKMCINPKHMKVQKSLRDIEYEVDDDGCWIPTNRLPMDNGRIAFNVEGYTSIKRYVYEKFYGVTLNKGIAVWGDSAKCRKKHCINPEHMKLNKCYEGNEKERPDGYKGRKLSKEEAIEIYESEMNNADLAIKFGVSYSTVYNIRVNKTWRHATRDKICGISRAKFM